MSEARMESQRSSGGLLFLDFLARWKWVLVAMCGLPLCSIGMLNEFTGEDRAAAVWFYSMSTGAVMFLVVWNEHRSSWSRAARTLPLSSDTIARLCWFEYVALCSAAMANPVTLCLVFSGVGLGGVVDVISSAVAICGSVCLLLTCWIELKTQTISGLGVFGLFRLTVRSVVALGVATGLYAGLPFMGFKTSGPRWSVLLLALFITMYSHLRRGYLIQQASLTRRRTQGSVRRSAKSLRYSPRWWARHRFSIMYMGSCFAAGAVCALIQFGLGSADRNHEVRRGIEHSLLIILSVGFTFRRDHPLRVYRLLPLSSLAMSLRLAFDGLMGCGAFLLGVSPLFRHEPHAFLQLAMLWLFCSGVGICLQAAWMALPLLAVIALLVCFCFLFAPMWDLAFWATHSDFVLLGIIGAGLLLAGIWLLYVVIAYKSRPYRLENVREAQKRA